jgi:hypothetical protein
MKQTALFVGGPLSGRTHTPSSTRFPNFLTEDQKVMPVRMGERIFYRPVGQRSRSDVRVTAGYRYWPHPDGHVYEHSTLAGKPRAEVDAVVREAFLFA